MGLGNIYVPGVIPEGRTEVTLSMATCGPKRTIIKTNETVQYNTHQRKVNPNHRKGYFKPVRADFFLMTWKNW